MQYLESKSTNSVLCVCCSCSHSLFRLGGGLGCGSLHRFHYIYPTSFMIDLVHGSWETGKEERGKRRRTATPACPVFEMEGGFVWVSPNVSPALHPSPWGGWWMVDGGPLGCESCSCFLYAFRGHAAGGGENISSCIIWSRLPSIAQCREAIGSQ